MNKQGKMMINVDCKPSFIRIPKGSTVDILKEMPNNYYMVGWKGMCLPVPKKSLEIIE